MFQILVKVDKIEKKRGSIVILHILSGLFLLSGAIRVNKYSVYNSTFLFSVLVITGILFITGGLFLKKFNNKEKTSTTLRLLQFFAFVLIGILLLGTKKETTGIFYLVWAVTCLFFIYSERMLLRQLLVSFEEKGIIIPKFFATHNIEWGMIEDVVIKPDHLTILQHNNTYHQYEISENINSVKMQEIRDFCSRHLIRKSNIKA